MSDKPWAEGLPRTLPSSLQLRLASASKDSREQALADRDRWAARVKLVEGRADMAERVLRGEFDHWLGR